MTFVLIALIFYLVKNKKDSYRNVKSQSQLNT